MAKNRIPRIVKHTTIAIYGKEGIHGSTDKAKFLASFDIARARLTEYGFLAGGSESGPVDNIKLTAKGMQRELKHSREPDAGHKNHNFDLLYNWFLELEAEGKEK